MIKLKDLLKATEETVWVHTYATDTVPFKAEGFIGKGVLDRKLEAIKIVEKHGVPSLHVWIEEK